MRLELDIAEQGVADLFPAHGWALNSQDIKLVWFPLRDLFSRLRLERRLKQTEVTDFFLPEDAEGGVAFTLTLHKLMVTLRELHHAIRVSCDHSPSFDDFMNFDANREALNEALGVDERAKELIPLKELPISLCSD